MLPYLVDGVADLDQVADVYLLSGLVVVQHLREQTEDVVKYFGRIVELIHCFFFADYKSTYVLKKSDCYLKPAAEIQTS